MIHQASKGITWLAIASTALASLQARDAFACSGSYAIDSVKPSAPITTTFNQYPPRILGPETKTVPPRYSGLSLFQVYLLLRKRFPGKSEYESTKAYKARQIYSQPFGVFYGYSSDHYLPFVQKVDNFNTKYNADTNELALEIRGIAGSPIVDMAPRIFIDFKILNEENYIGSNIYGNRVVVNRIASCSTSLSLKSIEQPITEGFTGLEIKIPMPPEIAQQVRGDLSIIYLTKLAPPFHSQNNSYTKPTIINPRESGNVEYIVHGDIGGVIVFQRSTGRVLFNGT